MAQILIIDDEEKICEFIAAFLIKDGHSVSIANLGKEGVKKINNENIDLIILDRMIPDISGDEICKTIKNKNLILYCVNLNLQNKKDIIDYNFENEEVKNKIKFFFLDGSINYDNLTRIDKIKLKKSLKKNRAFNVVKLEKNINVDRSDKHTIKPIINYVLEKTY